MQAIHAAARSRTTRRYAWYGLLVAATTALAGCVAYEARPLDPAHSLQEFSARRLDASALHDEIARLLPRTAVAWPPREWDRAELLAVALVSNRQLDVARVQVQAALAHEISTGETKNPDLILQSEYARHDPHPWLYGLGLDFLLRSSASKRLDIEFSRLETSNARWQLLDRVWTVRHALTAALADGELARRRQNLLQRLAAAQDDLLATEEKRVAVGEDTAAELLVARQARLETTQQQAEARRSAATVQSGLSAALGMPQSAIDQATTSWPDWGAPPILDKDELRQLREQALLSRSDLAATIDEYAQAEIKLHQAIRRQYPQFQLSPGYYWDHGIAKFPFDVGFTLPLFNRSQGEIAEARAAREVAGGHMLAVQAAIYAEIDAAEHAEQIARGSVAVAEHQLAVVQRQQEQAQLGLRLGALGTEETVGAEILTLRAGLELVQTQAQLQLARNALEDALHVPLSGPELDLAKAFTLAAAETRQ